MRKISLKNLPTKSRKKNKIKYYFSNNFGKTFSKLNHFIKKLFKKNSKIIKKFRKPKKKVTSFLGDVHHKIERNKYLSNSYLRRIVVVLFFFGINIQLLPFFLATTRVKLPNEILVALDNAGVIDKDNYIFEYIPEGLKYDEPSLEPQLILEKLNDERKIREKDDFIYNEKLATAAAELLLEFEKYDFELEDKVFTEEFKEALDGVGYNYEHVSQNMVVGPLKEDAVIDAWFSSEEQLVALFDDDFEEVGFATKIVTTKHNETLGVTVQVLGKEFVEKPAANIQLTIPQNQEKQKFDFPPISNEQVFEALNNYRQAHTVHKLSEDENLCKYAEKRVQDLIAFGGLDNHEGFKKDFEDQSNLPQSIQDYNGKNIAENLAFQHCKNMTTGEGFIAESGAAIIEWCFDSSTLGHREAQLSRDFGQACVRSGEGMFVVIFGEN